MGKAQLLETRRQVERGWWAVNGILVSQGRQELAAQVRRFSAQLCQAVRTCRHQRPDGSLHYEGQMCHDLIALKE
jgi:hypothetical protein